jgi:hypothetical protein
VATGEDFRGHQRGPQMATSGDFLVATDSVRNGLKPNGGATSDGTG